MFYFRSQNRYKHWYHAFFVGHKKLMALGVLLAFLLLSCIAVLVVYSIRASGYDLSLIRRGPYGSALYDSQKRLISALSERENTPVQWEELPPHLTRAFIAREDAHFFDHGGVVYTAFLRSLLRNVRSLRYAQGGSTITMQLTRHVFELQGKTLDRKLLEVMLAQRVEQNYDKQTIFCQYLSRIYFGQNCYGIREAAAYYFGKSVHELNLAESAMLAGIVRAPSLYNPKRSPELADKVRRETLQRMLELNLISQEDYNAAEAAPLPIITADSDTSLTNASYPALWANMEMESLPDVRDELGKGVSAISYLVYNIQQYLELALPQALEAAETPEGFADTWRRPDNKAQQALFTSARRPDWLRPGGSRLKPGEASLQACALVLDARPNKRGHILAIMGGRDASEGVNRWLAPVLPGRTIAPLVFCCASLPGNNAHHIVADSARITGSHMGYDMVHNFFSSLALDTTLPDRDHENELYDGLFPLKRIELARLLFSLQNEGRDYKPIFISSVWSQAQRLLYSADARQAQKKEYIPWDSASAVSQLSPFQYREGSPTILHEELPNNGGYWTMVINNSKTSGIAVFVWVGLETAGTPPPELTRDMRRLLSMTSLLFAKDLHHIARQELSAKPAAATPAAPSATPAAP